MQTEAITFESGPFLHSLFGENPAILDGAGQRLGVRITARGGLLKLHGPPEQVERARRFFDELEAVRRESGSLDHHAFNLALEAFLGEAGDSGLREVFRHGLTGGRGQQVVRPRTLTQWKYVQTMAREHVVFGVGPAGTGKTYLAVAHAVDAIRRGEFRKLVLTRPAVEAGEALGFLPGDLNEKILPYLRPLYDALYDLIGAEEVEKMIERGMVEIAPLAYMRGRTINHAFIILDEAQNTTCEQMFMFLTRLGEESRCAVTGDPSQIDLKPARRSGLLEARRILRDVAGVDFVEFGQADVVRHPVVQRIIEAYESSRSANAPGSAGGEDRGRRGEKEGD